MEALCSSETLLFIYPQIHMALQSRIPTWAFSPPWEP